jgi:hypothetical protein
MWNFKIELTNGEVKGVSSSSMLFKSYDKALGGALSNIINTYDLTQDLTKPVTLDNGVTVTVMPLR